MKDCKKIIGNVVFGLYMESKAKKPTVSTVGFFALDYLFRIIVLQSFGLLFPYPSRFL